MVVISHAPALSASNLQLFHTTDPTFSNAPIVVLYGPAVTSSTATAVSARVQSHVFTPAGFVSYVRLAISPTHATYSAVNCLSREEQGDQIMRTLAFSIFKYFGDLPEIAKDEWMQRSLTGSKTDNAPRPFSPQHAANLASRMVPAENPSQLVRAVEVALGNHEISSLDLDFVLPPGSIQAMARDRQSDTSDEFEGDETSQRYRSYAPLIHLFGKSLFIPTSKVQRAPSRPTAINRTIAFSKKQKENLRREMCEFVDTEESYVDKLNELVTNIAFDFREGARSKNVTSSSPDDAALIGLLPPSLDAIYEMNSKFYDEIHKVLDESEDRAIADIEATLDSSTASDGSYASPDNDVSGSVAFANALLSWLPRFEAPYGDYIQAQPNFGRLMKHFTTDINSTFTGRVHAVGEQKLMSMLIEPVQRLPRYSLYIDNIIKQLPVRHPALKQFLKAKDIISKICSPDAWDSGSTKLARMRALVPSWPSHFRPQARLITAVDVVELDAAGETKDNDDPGLLLLLFSQHIVFARRLSASALTSRAFIAEVEKTGPNYWSSGNVDAGLLFVGSNVTSDYHFNECDNGSSFRMTPARPPLPKTVVTPNDDRIRLFRLSGLNERRAPKLLADIMKARLEGRFPETERESYKWEARCTEQSKTGLNIFTAVFETDTGGVKDSGRRAAAVQILIDPQKHPKTANLGDSGVEVVASVSVEGQGFFRLEIEALNERSTRDMLTESEFLPVLVKRLGNLLQMRYQIRNPLITAYLLQHNSDILNSLSLAVDRADYDTIRFRNKRPQSPVKLLTNLFGGVSLRDQSRLKESQPSTPFTNAPRLLPPQPLSRSKSVQDVFRKENKAQSAMTIVGKDYDNATDDPFRVLEKALACYLMALQARKGNIVGSVVARRGFADEATVNELYNAVLGGLEAHERAAQASVDVLFAAFEQFLKTAWKDKLGPVIPTQLLFSLQSKMDVLGPLDYDEFEENKLADLAPQNRRALVDIITTLADLLEGTKNDGDRGVLTVSIVEAVVCDAQPHDFISLFDHFVENQDVLSPDRPASSGTLSIPGSMDSSMLTQSIKTGSVSSKASSFSKRLGLGSLRRDNGSKNEHARPTSSILRMGSRKALPPDPPVEDGRPIHSRSQSQDLESHLAGLRRPISRDQSTPHASDAGSRPGTSGSDKQGSSISSLASSPLKRSAATKLRKRRSSLSDLTTLQTPGGGSPFWSNSASKKVENIFEPGSIKTSPSRGVLPETPLKSASVRYTSPSRKENTPPIGRSQTLRELSSTKPQESEYFFRLPEQPSCADPFTSHRPAATSYQAPSQLPTSKRPLSERVASGNTPPPLNISPVKQLKQQQQQKQSVETDSPKKMRMESPTKLRDRLQTHSTAINSVQSSLQAEMLKIGQELMDIDSKLPASPRKVTPHQDQAALANLDTRLKAIETKVVHYTTNLTERTAALESDIGRSLQVSERKNKALDAELRHANAENEVLYARLNEELIKVFNQVKSGDGVEELGRQLRESRDEAAKWKKEAAKLRRENIKLNSLVG